MKSATSFDEFYRQIQLRKVTFLIVFFVVTLLSYTVLYIVDFIPEPIQDDGPIKESEVIVSTNSKTTLSYATSSVKKEKEVEVTVDPLPTKIFIDKLDKEITILNPQKATIAAMDASLLKGIVRHPQSADFQKTGNMLLLGHSSYLPNVINKNFQAFNGIQKLTWGDKIRVQSDNTEYVYRVNTIKKESATDVMVPYDWGTAKLTLVTCNVYGAKEDRFIVEASLISSQKI